MLTKERIVELLKRIKDPETELCLHDLGVVKYIDYEPGRRKLIICLDTHRRTPSCLGCQPIAWMVQRRIEDDLRRELSGPYEITEIEFRYC